MRRPLLAAVAATAALAATGLAAAPAGAGAGQPTVSVSPDPAVTGETVTVTPDEPCPNAANLQQVQVLVDDLDGGDEIYYPTYSDVTGAWELTFPAGAVGDYEITASCVYLQGNDVYRPASLTVIDQPTTTTTVAPSTTVAPTTTTAAPAPTVVAAPTFTG